MARVDRNTLGWLLGSVFGLGMVAVLAFDIGRVVLEGDQLLFLMLGTLCLAVAVARTLRRAGPR